MAFGPDPEAGPDLGVVSFEDGVCMFHMRGAR